MTGVFAENNGYAVLPRNADDFGRFEVRDTDSSIPYRLTLEPAFPNPFNSITNIAFEISHAGYVNVSVYDLAGRLIDTVIERELTAGQYVTSIDASALGTGVYILRLETKQGSKTQKLVLIK